MNFCFIEAELVPGRLKPTTPDDLDLEATFLVALLRLVFALLLLFEFIKLSVTRNSISGVDSGHPLVSFLTKRT